MAEVFRTIVADPPWPYKDRFGAGRLPKGVDIAAKEMWRLRALKAEATLTSPDELRDASGAP